MDENWNPLTIGEISDKLGEPRLVFKSDLFQLWLGISAGVVAWTTGLILAREVVAADLKWIVLVFGVGLPLLGSYCVRWLIGRIGLRVLVYDEGLFVVSRKKILIFPWGSITFKKRWHDGMHIVVRRDGETFEYDKDTIKNAEKLTALIQNTIDKRVVYREELLCRVATYTNNQDSMDKSWDERIYSDDFRNILFWADQRARKMQADYVGTEHLLFALLEEDQGPVATICKRLSLEPEAIRKVLEVYEVSESESRTLPSLPLTPMARLATKYSVEEARSLGRTSATPVDLFLGVLRCDEGIATHGLEGIGLRLVEARRAVAIQQGMTTSS